MNLKIWKEKVCNMKASLLEKFSRAKNFLQFFKKIETREICTNLICEIKLKLLRLLVLIRA